MLCVVFAMEAFAGAALAASSGGGSPPSPAPADLTSVKTIGVIILLALVMFYKKYKRDNATKGKYRKNKLHDDQVAAVAKLKRQYKLYFKRLYPNNIPDDKLTIECPSCKQINLLYEPNCKYCSESISLDETIIEYEEKIREIEFKIKESGLSPPLS